MEIKVIYDGGHTKDFINSVSDLLKLDGFVYLKGHTMVFRR